MVYINKILLKLVEYIKNVNLLTNNRELRLVVNRLVHTIFEYKMLLTQEPYSIVKIISSKNR